MISKKYAILCGASLVLSALVYALFHDYIIINYPAYSVTMLAQRKNATKKRVNLYVWAHEKLTDEPADILWSDNTLDALTYLVRGWLQTAQQEGAIDHTNSIQTVMLSLSHNELFISFEKPLFAQEAATFDKLMMVESLLKTVRETGSRVQEIRFLVQQQEMNDPHLDFSNSWPVEGFV